MSRALCEFAWTLRYHEQPGVRRAALVAMCTAGQAISPGDDNLGPEIGGLQMWLSHVTVHEVDEGCRSGPLMSAFLPPLHEWGLRAYIRPCAAAHDDICNLRRQLAAACGQIFAGKLARPLLAETDATAPLKF